MRGKAGKFSFALFLSIILLLGSLSVTVFLWSIFIDDRVGVPAEKNIPTMSLRDIPADGKSTPNIAPLTYPESINAQIMGIISGLDIQTYDLGLVGYWEPDSPYNDAKRGREVVIIGVSSGDYQGTLIITTPKGPIIATPHTLYAPDPPMWEENYALIIQRYTEWKSQLDKNSRLVSDESFKFPDSEGLLAWEFGGYTYVLSNVGLSSFNAPVEDTVRFLSKQNHVPFTPPSLHLAITTGLLSLLALALFIKGIQDIGIASVFCAACLGAVGGASLFLQQYVPGSLLPVASILSIGIMWTLPTIAVSSAFALDLTLGWFWLFYSVLASGIVLQWIFQPDYVWLPIEGIILALVLVVFISMAIRPKMPAKKELFPQTPEQNGVA
ncbi:MAG: hypothetical protein GX421_03970 [Caldisericales bacterium]|nr:hypothetical protein [Caldisericales bacterium]